MILDAIQFYFVDVLKLHIFIFFPLYDKYFRSEY